MWILDAFNLTKVKDKKKPNTKKCEPFAVTKINKNY